MYGIVYCTTNLVNGTKYIGQHKTNVKDFDGYFGSGTAFLRAIKKYGPENFIRETLCEAQDPEDLNELEEYYIDYYGAHKSKLFYNAKGGGNRGENTCLNKAILVYNLDGMFVSEYESATSCAKDLKINRRSISFVCGGPGKSIKGYQIKFKENEDYPLKIEKYKRKGEVSVACYDLRGNFITTYDSIKEASDDLNISPGSISSAVSNRKDKYLKAGKYQFRRIIAGEYPLSIERILSQSEQILNKNGDEIEVYDRKGNFLFKEKGAAKICRILNIDSAALSRCLGGEYSHTKGYVFKLKKNKINEQCC